MAERVRCSQSRGLARRRRGRSQNPLRLLFRALILWVSRHARLRRELSHIRMVDRGESFSAFRKVVVEPKGLAVATAGATVRVRFSFKNLSPKANRRLSLIPIPFIVAQPGFRSKTWLLGEHTGDFIGFYEFDSLATAEAYESSLPLRMMRRRAVPASLSYEVRAVGAGAPEADETQRREVIR